jgi:hypothetical protein
MAPTGRVGWTNTAPQLPSALSGPGSTKARAGDGQQAADGWIIETITRAYGLCRLPTLGASGEVIGRTRRQGPIDG